ncbi:porin family protein [Pelagivirga sediminicola]|uniref:Porin family protein n=1 Tax=Pelagivirga sediminicola TaxID=2170575 RepID=A0A2T7G4Q0_9RHOB|nr:porin family protein [Pelagivirga sediminicola]PVA09394.1 porin family protein [Pelagivirga sediminicola]
MKYLLSATAASALMAGTAFAGNIEPAPVEPVIAPAPAPVFTSPNWTGFYAGGQLGYANVDSDFPGDRDGDGFIGGLVLGYDYDLGNNWVIGGGFDYDWADIDYGDGGVNESTMESMWRAKVRGGYKIGNGLLYATTGYVNADTNNRGDNDGYFLGGGYEHMVSDQFSVGGEVLHHLFDDFTGSSDIDVTTAQVRATFRF